MKTYYDVNISLYNSKLGDKIPSLNLPPVVTCRSDAPCKRDCYALRGHFAYTNVKNSMKNNLDLYKKNKKLFFDSIIKFINNEDIIYRFFRWFSAGDIVDNDFFNGIIKVARSCKNTRFLLFTKKFNIINEYIRARHRIPKNLNIVFSGWDNNFIIENPFNFPVTFVKFKNKVSDYIPETAFSCAGSCCDCKACWTIKKGQAVYFDKH